MVSFYNRVTADVLELVAAMMAMPPRVASVVLEYLHAGTAPNPDACVLYSSMQLGSATVSNIIVFS